VLYCTYEAALGTLGRRFLMQTLKRKAVEAISRLPETASVDEMMYELYVIDKINKGREASERGDSMSSEDLKKETQSW
jgi:hypothetical protein